MKCPNCPFAGDPTGCVAERTGHVRFCELVDPDGPAYKPGACESVVRLTLGLPRPRPAPAPAKDRAAVEARRATKVRIPLGVSIPRLVPGRR